MKFKKSRFKLGSFSFGLGGGNSHHPTPSSPTEPPIDPFLQNLGLREESRLKSASLASLMRKSHVRSEPMNTSAMPELLAIRKCSSSDFGINETPLVMKSQLEGKSVSPKNSKSFLKSSPKSEGISWKSGNLFRMFHKSSTLTFKHPVDELNDANPYKATAKTQSKYNSKASLRKHPIVEPVRDTEWDYHRYNNQSRQRSSSQLRLTRQTSEGLSSTTSLTTSSIDCHAGIHQNHLDSKSPDSSKLHLKNLLPEKSVIKVVYKRNNSCSPRSIVSSRSARNEDYDSGAFSTATTPDSSPPRLRSTIKRSALLSSSTASISRLPAAEPLTAPSLVLAACLRQGVSVGDVRSNNVDANLMIKCLAAAAGPSSVRHPIKGGPIRKDFGSRDVSITISPNSKLIISNGSHDGQRIPQFRRNRTGLPLLGIGMLPASGRSFNPKVSKVYIEPVTSPSPSQPCIAGACGCRERVTVNGEHHCPRGRRTHRATTTAYVDVEGFPDLKRRSVIEI